MPDHQLTVAEGLARLPGPEGRAVRRAVPARDAQRGAVRAARARIRRRRTRGTRCTWWRRGSGQFRNGGGRHPFGPGDLLFVPAGVVHRFEDFSDDLAVWVFFYGPEGGEAAGERGPDERWRTRADAAARGLSLARACSRGRRSGSSAASGSASAARRSWPAPGDYVVKDVAGESILIVRTREGGLAGALQRLPPPRLAAGARRAAPAASPAASAARTTRGPTRSRARSARRRSSRSPTGSRRSELSLHPVGVDTWGGFVFVHLTPARRRPRGASRWRRSSARCPTGSGAIRSPSSGWRGGSPTRSRPTGR